MIFNMRVVRYLKTLSVGCLGVWGGGKVKKNSLQAIALKVSDWVSESPFQTRALSSSNI